MSTISGGDRPQDRHDDGTPPAVPADVSPEDVQPDEVKDPAQAHTGADTENAQEPVAAPGPGTVVDGRVSQTNP